MNGDQKLGCVTGKELGTVKGTWGERVGMWERPEGFNLGLWSYSKMV